MISDEAVAAAANTVRLAAWGHITPEEAAKQILEAAAPHMLAEAWDEGVSDGQWNAEHIYQIDAGARHAIPNPYRSQE